MLSTKLDPQTWDAYKFNEIPKQLLTKYVASGVHPSAISFVGTSGVGKTAGAKLYIKSTLCRNREPGDFNPCNNCVSCKSDPRTVGPAGNVIWIQQGVKDSINTQVSRAIEEAQQPPNGLQDDHRHFKFIVIDEMQSVPKDQLERFLLFPELKRILTQNKVIFIFMTMNALGINPKIAGPLFDRSRRLDFNKFSANQVLEYLQGVAPKAPTNSLSVIAQMSKGSLRSALTTLELCYEVDPSLSIQSTSAVTHYADAKVRAKLWKLIQGQNVRELLTFWNNLVDGNNINPDTLIEALLEDLINEMIRKPNELQYQIQALILNYLSTNAKVSPFNLLVVISRVNILDPRFVRDSYSIGETEYDKMFS